MRAFDALPLELQQIVRDLGLPMLKVAMLISEEGLENATKHLRYLRMVHANLVI
jgi:hypothetical protein